MTLRTPAFNDAKTYPFVWLRALAEADLQEGVLGPGDLKVAAPTSAGQRVDVAAGTALVKGDSGIPGTGLTHGIFMVVNDAAIPNAVTLAASNGSLPRLDQIALRVRDTASLGTGFDDTALVVLTGAATSGATLDNRSGAAALPNDHVRLADVLVPAGSTGVVAGNIRDRRPWARGLSLSVVDTTTGGGNAATTSTTPVAIGAARRIECTGRPLRIDIDGTVGSTTASSQVVLGVLFDGAVAPGTETGAIFSPGVRVVDAGARYGASRTITIPAPTAGSHLIAPSISTTAQGVVYCNASTPLMWSVDEVRSAAND